MEYTHDATGPRDATGPHAAVNPHPIRNRSTQPAPHTFVYPRLSPDQPHTHNHAQSLSSPPAPTAEESPHEAFIAAFRFAPAA